ncbi:armadillo-type protein [Dichotomocladium elegans]|nr:armadillo-type protein [Dichotomocladium elegans]
MAQSTHDTAAICAQFEEACSDFQVPATRAAAEHILSSFRQIPEVLPICQYILGMLSILPSTFPAKKKETEHAQSPMAQFQVALATGEVAVRDYTLYALSDIVQLKNYLVDYCLKRPDLMKYVRLQLLSDAALITKRSLFDISGGDRDALCGSVKQLISMQGHESLIGITLASALLDHFSSTKATATGLSWEFHHKAKVFFEDHVLLGLFEQSVTRLHAVVSQQRQQQQPDELINELVTLLEKILQWEFESTSKTVVLPGTFAKTDREDDYVDRENGPGAVKKTYTIFPKTWRPVVANTEVLWLFFMTYGLVQNDDVLGHRCRQCLVQLAGFTHEFFNNDPNTTKLYATTMVQGILRLMSDLLQAGSDPSNLSEHGPQMLGTIQMIRRLFENVPLAILCSIPEFFQFLNDFGKMTIASLRGMTAQDIDEGWIGEASDECLETWVRLADLAVMSGLSPVDRENLAQYLRNVAFQIVETYVDAKLEQSKQSIMDDEDEEEIDGGFKDWDTFADQLTCIGTLGRLDPHKSLLYLQQLLTDRFNRLKEYFAKNSGESSGQYITFLQEHMHWIILIIAHILADAGNGEQPMIPESLMQLSGSQSVEQDQITSISRLILEIFRFLSGFSTNSVEASYCSPQVAETLIWFNERWSKSYLLVNENDYGYMSPNIAHVFGRPGPSDGQGLEIVDFYIDQIKANFILWNADPDVLVQIIRWLNTCGISVNLKTGFLQSGKFPDLVQFITENVQQLPEVVHNSLIQTITTMSSGANDPGVRERYLGMIFGMIEKRLGSVLHRPDFMQNYQRADVMNDVMNALEMLDGLALASEYSNTQIIFNFGSRFFESILQLMDMYKTVNEMQVLILQFLSDLAGRLDFGLLEMTQKQMLFRIIVEVLKSYGASNRGKKRMHSQEEEADRPYPDIAVSLSLLTNIMASEFEDFSKSPVPPGNADVADVVLFGVNVIIPMIDLEMLKIPSLCQQYIKLISNLIEFFPDKLVGLPTDLFNNLMASLEFGVGHDIVDVSILALQAVAPLALWAHHQMLSHASNIDFLKPAFNKFLEQLIRLLLFDNLDSSVVDAASEALLFLICAEREAYLVMVNQIISQQSSEIQPRLLHAFEKLDTATPRELPGILPPTRNVAGFKAALFEFLINVRAVLRIK